MSDERALLNEIEADSQKARAVCYVEGPTDVEMLFALLGVERPHNAIHQDVYVVSPRSGRGSSAVSARVRLAEKKGYPGIYGVLDGDGRSFSELSACFDPPCSGPLFSWKAYCIENLLAQVAWPAVWGAVPDWPEVLRGYSPYVALNRLGLRLRDSLRTLGLHNFANPGTPLLTVAQVEETLRADKHLLANLDVHAEFSKEIEFFERALHNLDEAHALVNGKWLVDNFAPRHTGRTPETCRSEWSAAARAAGGHPQVAALWSRLAA